MGNDLETGEELGQLVQVNDTTLQRIMSVMSHLVYNGQLSHLFIMCTLVALCFCLGKKNTNRHSVPGCSKD